MKQTDGAKKQLELLLQRYPILAGQRDEIDGAYQIIAAEPPLPAMRSLPPAS